MFTVFPLLSREENVIQRDRRTVAHTAEYSVLRKKLRGSVELGDRACVHNANPIVTDDRAKTICMKVKQSAMRLLGRTQTFEYVRAMHRIVRSLNTVAIVS